MLWQPFSFRNAPAAGRHTTYPHAFALPALRPSEPTFVHDQYDYDRACNYSQTKDSISITGAQYVAGISQLQSIFFYRDAVPDLLIRWKYDGMVELTNLTASWVANHCQISASYDLATIVPCHWRRRLTRGFDHMWLLANALAKTGLIKPPTKILEHSKPLPFLHLHASSDRHIDPDHFHTVCSVKGKRLSLIHISEPTRP